MINDEINTDWLIGLLETKGIFGLKVQMKNKKPKEYRQFNPMFTLQLREEEEKLMIKIYEYLGVGSIGMVNQKRSNEKNPNLIKICISGKHDALTFINKVPLYKFRTNKKKQYKKWIEITKIVNETTLSNMTIEQIRMLRKKQKKLSNLKAYRHNA